MAFWQEAVERERGQDAEEALRARRRLHASATFGGMVRVDGDLEPESGESLLTALGAVMDAEARSGEEDDRSPAQRRADALGEICRQWLDLADRPTVAGERPHLVVTVPVESLSVKVRPSSITPAGAQRGSCGGWPATPRSAGW